MLYFTKLGLLRMSGSFLSGNITRGMRQRISRKAILPLNLIILFIICEAAYADNEKIDTTLQLKEVVVTGSRVARPLTETPGSIRLITPVVLKNSPTWHVDDILMLLSGVNTTRASGLSSMRNNVSIRGLAGEEQGRTLVLFDGIPINTSDGGEVNWNSIHVENVERIEVFKGPGSSIYGNNAMGGVINIISKQPESPFSFNGSSSYGSQNTWMNNVGVSSQFNKNLALFISGYYNRSDGYNHVPDSLRSIPDYTIKRYVKEGGVFTKLLITPSSYFNLDIGYDVYKDKRGEGMRIEEPDGKYRHFDHHRIQARLHGGGEKRSYNVAAYFQRENYLYQNEDIKKGTYTLFNVNSDRDDWGLIGHYSFEGKHHNLTVGGELRNGKTKGGDYYVTSTDMVLNQGEMTFLSFFLQEEISMLQKRIWLQMALRYDNVHFHNGNFEAIGDNVSAFSNYNGELNSNRWEHISPRVALRFNLIEAASLYISYSQGFRASILDDLCRSGWMWIGPKLANPDLGPEILNNYEIGGTFTFSPQVTLSASCYYARGKDFLYYTLSGEKLWGVRDLYIRDNISRVKVKGVEIDVDFYPMSDFKVALNYTYNRPTITSYKEKPELKGKVLTYAPQNQLKGYILWTNRVFDIMLQGHYKSKQYMDDANQTFIPGFSIWDANLSKRFFDHRMQLCAEILNVFDKHYMYNKEYMSNGRLFNIKLSLQLSK